MTPSKIYVVHAILDLFVLKTLDSMGILHGFGIAMPADV